MSKTNIDSEIVNWYEVIKKEKPELLIKIENPNYDYHGLNLHMRAIISGGWSFCAPGICNKVIEKNTTKNGGFCA